MCVINTHILSSSRFLFYTSDPAAPLYNPSSPRAIRVHSIILYYISTLMCMYLPARICLPLPSTRAVSPSSSLRARTMQFEETIYASSMYAHQIPTIAVTFVLTAIELHARDKSMCLNWWNYYLTDFFFIYIYSARSKCCSTKFFEFLRYKRKIDLLTRENLR